MKLGIMQPYLLPYIGYFQLIKHVDEFVIYDNIQFTKKGWINRNRVLQNGKDIYFTIPLKKDSDYLDIRERSLAEDWLKSRAKMLNTFKECYRKAPHFPSGYALLEEILFQDELNLFTFIHNGLLKTLDHLKINTPVIVSSSFEKKTGLKGQDRVLEICKLRNAETYVNPIGGTELYSSNTFNERGIKLQFIKTTDIRYTQLGNEFIPFLSIIDVIMFNDLEQIHYFLNNAFELM